MPSLADITAAPFVKIMLIGDSGSGKTGALTSLVKAGYKLKIMDMDEGLSPLVQLIRAEDPKLLANVEYESFRDSYRPTPQGMQLVMPAKAYLNATRLMNKWTDDSQTSELGPDYIFVIDSFTLLCKAAFAQAISLAPSCKDPRQWYASAQQAAENFLACVTGPDFKTNVIVISHITDIELADGSKKGFPSAVGQALSRHIAKYLNNLFIVESRGQGNNVKRVIRTVPNGHVDAKTAAIGLPAELPIETGLATIFEKLKGI